MAKQQTKEDKKLDDVKAFEDRLKACTSVMDIFLIMPYSWENLDQYQILEMRAKRAGIDVPTALSCENVAGTIKMLQNKGEEALLEDFRNILMMMLNTAIG